MKTINIDKIDVNDKRFCISHPLRDEVLLESIGKVGLLEPVMLLDATPYVIVAGFKRILAAAELGLTEVLALTVNIDEKRALLHSIHSNLGRGLNIVEKAHSLERMSNLGLPATEIYETMGLLGLSPHQKVLDRLIVLARGDAVLKDFLLAKALSMKNVESLLRFDPEERARIIDTLASFRTTDSFVREILELLGLIKARRGNIDFSLMKDAPDPQELKKSLRKLTNPILSSLEISLKQAMARCSLPPNLDIKVDPFFEKGYIDILIRAKSDEEVREALKKLGLVLDEGCIGSILELTKG
jgi:ParB-like chromosome segregation protein Spo0J